MPPKLNKLLPPQKTPPKGSLGVEKTSLNQTMPPLSSSSTADPFAPKKSLLGAISPQKDKEKEFATISVPDRSNENDGEEETRQLEEDSQQQREEAALLEAKRILAEEIRIEEELQQEQQAVERAEQARSSAEDVQVNTIETTNDEEKVTALVDEEEMNKVQLEKLSQEEDEFLEATMLAAQEAKINQIINKKSNNHMAAYEKPLSALSLDIPLLRAVFKDDIDTVKLFLTEDFADCGNGDLADHFLQVRDSRGRTALHVAAAGDSPLMVEYLLTHNRVCLEQMKYKEMQKIKEERKSCLLELKMSMKKSITASSSGKDRISPDSFSKNDYRVAAIEFWFEEEVARVHRKVELLTEAQWLSGLLQRDKQGLSPLHYAVHSGSVEVLRALLCVPPFFTGRGIFSAAQKQKQQRNGSVRRSKQSEEKLNEWFKTGGVYNSSTGEEVGLVHKLQTGSGGGGSTSVKETGNSSISMSMSMSMSMGKTWQKKKLTLHDVAQVSSFNAYISPSPHEEETDSRGNRTKADYDIVVPWLVRNVYRRSLDMGKKLGASAIDVLEEMIEMVNPDKGRVLILPEIRELLRYLGIVVTTDVIKELCNIYPATLDLVEEKYQRYQENEDEMLLSDSKSFSSNFPNSDKYSYSRSSKSTESKHNDDSDSKGTTAERRGERGSKGSKSSTSESFAKGDDNEHAVIKKKSLFDPSSEEVTFGLALDLFLDDIASGRGMQSIFSETPVQPEEGTLRSSDTDEREGKDEKELAASSQGGRGEGRNRIARADSFAFQMPAVVSVANIRQYRKLLLNCRDGAGNTALIVAAALGKLPHVEELIAGGADISIESLDGRSPLSVSRNASIIGILQRELVTQLKLKQKNMLMGSNSEIMSNFQKSSSTLHPPKDFVDSIKLPHNEVILSSTSASNDNRGRGNGANDMVLQLHDLKTKRWAYSQSALAWAVESGSQDTIDNMLAGGIDTNEADISGRSPLHTCLHLASQACSSQALLALRKMTESILNSGADIHASTISGKTPLHELFMKNKCAEATRLSPQENLMLGRMRAVLVRSLLQWGAEPLRTDRQGYSSLYYCAKENMSACMIEMLKARAVNVNFQDPRGRTALHTACIHGAEAVATILTNYAADYVTGLLNIEDKDGKTAKHLMSPHMPASCLVTLWHACRMGDIRRVNAILAKQKTRNDQVAYENVEEEQAARNPLDVTSGQEDAHNDLWMLGGADCKTRLHKWTPLHACIIGWAEFNATKTKNKNIIRALKHGEISSKLIAVTEKKLSFRNNKASFPANLTDTSFSTIVSVLIQNFAYIDSLEFKCRTPLMLAAAFDLSTAVALLCTAGADVNLRDLDGNTALHYAYACGSNHAVSALEDRNVDSSIENNDGKTAFEVMGLIGTIAPFFKKI